MQDTTFIENVRKYWPMVASFFAVIVMWFNMSAAQDDHEKRIVRMETQMESVSGNMNQMQNSLTEISTKLDIYLKRFE